MLRRTRVWVLLLAGLGPVTAAYAFSGGTVFDPANFAENVRQAVALLEQLDRAARQLALQRQMLRQLPASILTELQAASAAVLQRVAAHFDPATPDVTGVAAELDATFPLAPPAAAPAWLAQLQPAWDDHLRAALVEQRAYQNAIAADMAPASARLATLVRASNGRQLPHQPPPGTTAVVQAHNELLALHATELNQLIALRAARARSAQLARASSQSASAYQRQRRDVLMRDWPTTRAGDLP